MDRYRVISLYIPEGDSFDYHLSQHEAQLRAGDPLIIAREDGFTLLAVHRTDRYYYEAQDLLDWANALVSRSASNT